MRETPQSVWKCCHVLAPFTKLSARALRSASLCRKLASSSTSRIITEMTFAVRGMPFLSVALLSIGLAAAPLTVARAQTIVHKSVSYFTIGGKTAIDLDRELQRRGPMLKTTGTRHPGATRITFGGDATYVEEKGRCRIAAVRVTVTAKIMLPRWKNRRSADLRLGILWDTLSGDIRRHEERHAEIARNHAREIERQLKRLSARSSCASLHKDVSRVSRALIVAHDRDQARFDRVEAVNFESRMVRLLKSRLSAFPTVE